MKSAERPFGRVINDFFTPSTSASVLIRTHRCTLRSSPCTSGMFQWDSTGTISASGQRPITSCPRCSSRAAGSA